MGHTPNRHYTLSQLERWARKKGYAAEARACRKHRARKDRARYAA